MRRPPSVNSLYVMHAVENILVHRVDGEAHFLADCCKPVSQFAERNGCLGNVNHHNHGEEIL